MTIFEVSSFLSRREINGFSPLPVLSKQLLRSGTSIGANLEEAVGGQSEADFLSKISIAYKEARETHYWIRLLKATNYFTEEQADNLLKDVNELMKIMTSIKMTMQQKMKARHS